MAAIPISRKIILDKIKEDNKPPKPIKEKSRVAPPKKYKEEVLEAVITVSDFWYSDMEGTIIKVKESASGEFFQTVDYIKGTCQKGNINKAHCEII